MAKEKSVSDIIAELREQSEFERKQAQGFRLQQSKADKDREKQENTRAEQTNAIFRSISYDIKSQTRIVDAQYKASKANRLDKLEEQRERVSKAKLAVGDDFDNVRDFEKKVKKIREGFVAKITKLAFGIIGAGAFVLLAKNFDAVKEFVTDKLIPVMKSVYTFAKDTVFPFVADNFREILTGIMGIAGLIIGTKIITKIATATKILIYGFRVLQLNVMSVASTLTGGVQKAFRLMQKAFIFFRVTMLKEFIPTVIGSLQSAMSSVGRGMLKAFKVMQGTFLAFKGFMTVTFFPAMIATMSGLLTSLGAILLPFAPIIAIGALIALAVASIGIALVKMRDALGFESIFDVLMLGVMHLKDAFGNIVNAVGAVVNFVIGIYEKIARFIPGLEGIELPRLPKMDTDSAEKFKAEKQETKATALPEPVTTQESKKFEVKPNANQIRAQKLQDRMIQEQMDFEEREKYGVVTDEDRAAFEKKQAEFQRRITFQQEKAAGITDASQRYNESKSMESAGAGMVAVNAPNTTVNNNANTAVYSDPSPATDDLDRAAMAW